MARREKYGTLLPICLLVARAAAQYDGMWRTGVIDASMVTASSHVINPGDTSGLCYANTSMLCQVCVDTGTGQPFGSWTDSWCADANGKANIDGGGKEWIQFYFGALVVDVVYVEL